MKKIKENVMLQIIGGGDGYGFCELCDGEKVEINPGSGNWVLRHA